jgi:hypothetical protein
MFQKVIEVVKLIVSFLLSNQLILGALIEVLTQLLVPGSMLTRVILKFIIGF